jgi:hypothetical protein
MDSDLQKSVKTKFIFTKILVININSVLRTLCNGNVLRCGREDEGRGEDRGNYHAVKTGTS